jgi:excisionase family DNA binding protein
VRKLETYAASGTARTRASACDSRASKVGEGEGPPTGPVSPAPFLTVNEAAQLLRCKPQRIYDLLSAHRLTRFKDGSRVLLSRAEVEAWVGGG